MQPLLHNVVELISLIIAIIYYPYIKRNAMKWTLPFLVFIFLAEIIAKYQVEILKKSTINTYYLILLVETIFYSYMFVNMTKNLSTKKIITVISIATFLIYTLAYFIYNENVGSFYFNITAEGILLSVMSIIYLYSFVNDYESYKISQEPAFWVAFGVAVFFSVSTIVMSLHKVIVIKKLFFLGQQLHNIIPQILSVILYSSLSIAIILCKKKTRISSLPS